MFLGIRKIVFWKKKISFGTKIKFGSNLSVSNLVPPDIVPPNVVSQNMIPQSMVPEDIRSKYLAVYIEIQS